MKYTTILILTIFFINTGYCQVKLADDLGSKYVNWHNRDYDSTEILGTSVDKAYALLKARNTESKTVIVAVIDSGIDIDHEDLQGKIWINQDEIPDNGIDDDGNGYIDDIHGWNFIGNASGENVNYENMEFTRIIRNNDTKHPDYKEAKRQYDEELERRTAERKNLDKFLKIYNDARSTIKSETGITVNSIQDLNAVRSDNPKLRGSVQFLRERYAAGFTDDILNNLIKTNDDFLNYFLNLEFNARDLVGDDPSDINDRNYGNPDVEGPRADHGTSVAGIIAANRNNDIGIDGIASDVKIMCIRSTPKGDERDKDVALAIYYAVDNGASIVNMSFGKPFSPHKKFVDDAVKYAEEKGVLLVHGSGNSGNNIDVVESYPSDRYMDDSEATNWINVGASSMILDENVAAFFSNYGKDHVDIFAPGVDIVSTDSSGYYNKHDGTSLAAPVVSGIAALILSYYPDLSPQELISILMDSSYKITKPKKVLEPSTSNEKRQKVKFTELSRSGGIVNAYNALIMAEKQFE